MVAEVLLRQASCLMAAAAKQHSAGRCEGPYSDSSCSDWCFTCFFLDLGLSCVMSRSELEFKICRCAAEDLTFRSMKWRSGVARSLNHMSHADTFVSPSQASQISLNPLSRAHITAHFTHVQDDFRVPPDFPHISTGIELSSLRTADTLLQTPPVSRRERLPV